MWLALPALAAALAYLNTLGADFVYDDLHQIVENPWVKSPRFLAEIVSRPVWAFQTTAPTNYWRPVQMGLYNLLWFASSGSPLAFHGVNVLLHVLTTAAVALLVFRLSGDRLVAGSAAVLFAVHPANTEAVSWIACLPELTYAFFLVAALLLHELAGRTKPPTIMYRMGALGAFALALLSKETAIVLPLLVVLAELSIRTGRPPGTRGGASGALRAALPYAAVAGSYLLVRWLVVGGLAPRVRGTLTLADAVVNAPPLLASYLRLLAIPADLLAYHIFEPIRSVGDPRLVLGLAATAVVGILLVVLWRRRRDLMLAGGLLILPLLPVLYVPAIGANAFAERYAYLPSVGAAWLTAAALVATAKRLARPAAARRIVAGIVGAVALAFGGISIARNRVWSSDETLATATLRREPRATHMHLVLGAYYTRQGKQDLALAQYERGVAGSPADPLLRAALVTARLGLRRIPPEDAARDFASIVEEYPSLLVVWINLGAARMLSKEPERAEEAYRRALALSPDDGQARAGVRLARVAQGKDPFEVASGDGVEKSESIGAEGKTLEAIALAKAGRLEEAELALREALRLEPGSGKTLYQLAAIRAGRGDGHEAIVYFRRAIAASPDLEPAYLQIGIIAGRLGDYSQAEEALETAVRLAPSDKVAYVKLGAVFAVTGRAAEARRAWESALAIDPGFAEARAYLRTLDEQESRRKSRN